MYVPTLLPSLISMCYTRKDSRFTSVAISSDFSITAFIIHALVRKRKEMDEFYNDGSVQSFSRSNYFRLMALSCTDIFITFPTEIFLMTEAIISAKQIYNGHIPGSESWHKTHQSINEIFFVPAVDWRTHLNVGVYQYANWMNFVFALLFFLFFGTTGEMVARYKKFFWFCVKPCGVRARSKQENELPEMQFEDGPVEKRYSNPFFVEGEY